MADTKLTIEEIEVALAESRDFSYLKNLMVFNVYGLSELLPINHECDVLVMTKTGYLTEIEIKRSWSDFLADFKKEHHHQSEYIKKFYYCVPVSIVDKVAEYLKNNDEEVKPTSGIITYDEDGYIKTYWASIEAPYPKKLFLEQQLELARLGCMRVVVGKKKIIKLKEQ